MWLIHIKNSELKKGKWQIIEWTEWTFYQKLDSSKDKTEIVQDKEVQLDRRNN